MLGLRWAVVTSPSPEPTGSPDSLTPGSAFAPLVGFAGMAALAVWLDVAVGRGAVRVLAGTAARETALSAELAGRYVQNLAAVLCLLGLVAAARTSLRDSTAALGLLRRIALGGLLGVLMPTLGISVFLPEASTSVLLVLVGFAAGHLCVLLLGASAFSERAPIEQRVACALAAAMAVANFGELVAEYFLVGSVSLQHQFGVVGELLYFALPLAVALGVLLREPNASSRRRAAISVAVGAIVALSVHLAGAYGDLGIGVLLYGALRLSALETAPAIVYAALIGISIAAAAFVASSRAEVDRRLGIGLLLVLAAGAGPRSSGTIACLVLGSALIGLVRVSAQSSEAEASSIQTAS